MLCHSSLFIFSLCPHLTFYKTLTSLSTVFIKGHVVFLRFRGRGVDSDNLWDLILAPFINGFVGLLWLLLDWKFYGSTCIILYSHIV